MTTKGIAIGFVFMSMVFAVYGAEPKTVLFDKMDTNHSTVAFVVPIFGGFSEVQGKFTDFSVSVQYSTDLSRASVKAVIKTASIDTGVEDRDNDLRSSNFFDVVKYPEITFVSARIERRGTQYLAVGSLTMHGISKEIELPFEVHGPDGDEGKGFVFGIKAETTLDRDDFGITWRHPKEAFVGDQIQIKIRLITKLTKAPQLLEETNRQ